MNKQVKIFWNQFLKHTNHPIDTKCFEIFYFGHTKQTAHSLAKLVLSGKKTATTSCIYQYQDVHTSYPTVGDLSIVTDFAGHPLCVIETTQVITLPFNEMTYELCKREGEDDTLESWKKSHTNFFTAIGKDLNFEFTEELEIIFEDFVVVYRS